jgi:hypothetical protein
VTIVLERPVLARRNDRKKLAPVNPKAGDPESWFKTKYFVDRGILSTTFDFFVNWPEKRIGNEVWLKRIMTYKDRINDYRQHEKEIADCDGKQYSQQTFRLLKYYGLIEKYMIFRNVPEERWDNREEKILEYDISERNGNASLRRISVDELEDEIKSIRQSAPSIGAHGLIYSTSTLEGYLSEKDYIWPGDVDTILFEPNENYKVNAVLEFKKHTASSHIAYEDEKLSNYYKRDILKYESLGLLRDFFQSSLYVIFFPVESKYTNIYVEKVSGPYDDLKTQERYAIPIPDKNSEISMSIFADTFCKIMGGNYGQKNL